MANPKSIEVKVGMLILVALSILAGFVLIMGGINFQPTYGIFVDFDNPGGLQTGAPLKIAGVKVGSVSEVQFRGASPAAQGPRREPLVRLRVSVERRYREAIHENAVFYVTTQGVLGEQFLAADPGSTDRPVLAEGTIVRGLDPPRLDMLLAEGYELLHTTIEAMRDNRQDIRDAFDGMRDTLKGTGHFFNTNRDRLDRIAANVETITVDADDLVRSGKAKYVDNPQIDRVIGNVERTTASINRDADGLLKDARETLANARRVSTAIGGEEETKRLQRTLADVSDVAARAKLTAADAQSIVAHIKKGDGSVGNLVMSEQLYDDLQELVRDLKHNPWKFFWKE
ncbi:MAG: MCE family protein [Myxococcales bacterium]|nr:MAG: MCE family protein [Myxococcales bacterium]